MERYPWWRFDPRLEWIEPHRHKDDNHLAYIAGVPGEVRIAYLPQANFTTFFPTLPELATGPSLKILDLEEGAELRAFYFDPRRGHEFDLGAVVADQDGNWKPPAGPPTIQDWVLVLEAV